MATECQIAYGSGRCNLVDLSTAHCQKVPSGVSLAERIRTLRLELAALEEQQRQELFSVLTTVIPAGTVFSARDLFDHRVISPALALVLDDAGITSARKLGKRLQQITEKEPSGISLVRIGLEHGRARGRDAVNPYGFKRWSARPLHPSLW